jgi:hypothetical protein
MKKIKKLCGIKKDGFQAYEDAIINIVKNPRFICKKCLRVANDKKHLCKPSSIK